MLVCPKPTTHLHKFRQDDRMYVADLSQCIVLEINNITWDILDPLSSPFKRRDYRAAWEKIQR